MTSIDTEIKDLETEIIFKTNLINELKAMKAIYPDLERDRSRWDKIVLCSASINNKVTNYETRYNCGCCGDTPLEVWFFIELEGSKKRIYSNPACFFVAKKNGWGSDKPFSRWKDDLRNSNIPESMIKKIADLLNTKNESKE